MPRWPIEPNRSPVRRLAAGLALGCAFLTVAGCSQVSNTIADMPGIGEPAATPPRPPQQADYPPVFDRPPPREQKPMTAAERQQLENELKTTRDRQAQQAEQAKQAPPPSN
jgi:hypothetical protein